MTKIILPQRETNTTEERHSTPHFSYSQLSMYLRCGMQYKHRYIMGIIRPPSLPMQSGKAIHEALEYNSRFKIQNKEDMPPADLLEVMSHSHDKYTEDIEDETPKAIGKDKDESLGIVQLYRHKQAPTIKPIAVEYPFSITLPEDEEATYLPVIGYVDTYQEVQDQREGPTKNKPIIALEDYKKIGRNKRSQGEIDWTPQLTLYDYVFNLQTGQMPDVVGYRQLGYNKDGPFSLPTYRTATTTEKRKNRWERMLNQFKRVQQAIQKGVFLPVDDAKTCSWCGYRDICQDRKDI